MIFMRNNFTLTSSFDKKTLKLKNVFIMFITLELRSGLLDPLAFLVIDFSCLIIEAREANLHGLFCWTLPECRPCSACST